MSCVTELSGPASGYRAVSHKNVVGNSDVFLLSALDIPGTFPFGRRGVSVRGSGFSIAVSDSSSDADFTSCADVGSFGDSVFCLGG